MSRSIPLWAPLLLALSLVPPAFAEDKIEDLGDAQKTFAIGSSAVVVAHVGMVSPSYDNDPGYAALWIDHAMKGRLRAGYDIVWVSKKEFPKALVDSKYWLMFLRQDGDGSWHILNNDAGEGLVEVKDLKAAEVKRASHFLGAYGPAAQPDAIPDDELHQLMKRAARGSQENRRAAMATLVASSDIRPALEAASTGSEREVASLSRTLLPLVMGGPEVNGLRLFADPAVIEIKADERRTLSISYANVSDEPLRVVTGASTWGDNVVSAAAWDVRPMPDGKKVRGAALTTVLGPDFGVSAKDDSPPQPIVRQAPSFGLLPMAVELRLETAAVDGKDVLRLHFTHGYVDIPGPGTYSLRAHFDCPGPRPDQQRLVDAQYWKGGRLVSNEIVLQVK